MFECKRQRIFIEIIINKLLKLGLGSATSKALRIVYS